MIYARRSARVILVDGEQRVLLFHARKSPPLEGSLWFTVGGGVDKGEELHLAAAREVFEETGLKVEPQALLPLVAVSEGHADIPGWKTGQFQDNYFFWQVGSLEIDRSGQTAFEAWQLLDSRWWSIEELRATTEEIVPRPLADLVEQFCAGRIPEQPLVIPWHM